MRDAAEGSSYRAFEAPLRADDLLPIEMLDGAAAGDAQPDMMLEKLIDSEKFAGLGQLAECEQQLNNR